MRGSSWAGCIVQTDNRLNAIVRGRLGRDTLVPLTCSPSLPRGCWEQHQFSGVDLCTRLASPAHTEIQTIYSQLKALDLCNSLSSAEYTQAIAVYM